MSSGAWVLVTMVALAVVFGVYRGLTDGNFRGTKKIRDNRGAGPAGSVAPGVTSVLAETPWEAELGERFTLLQFSSAFCAPCRATRRILEEVAGTVPGVRHLEV